MKRAGEVNEKPLWWSRAHGSMLTHCFWYSGEVLCARPWWLRMDACGKSRRRKCPECIRTLANLFREQLRDDD